MPAVRYVVLLALVVWLGGMLTVLLGDLLRPLPLTGAACGSLILIGLFVMKFVGPPPHGFIPRAALTAVMLLLVAASAVYRTLTAQLMAVNVALGLVLLFWYVRE
jgi:hypothetical protein